MNAQAADLRLQSLEEQQTVNAIHTDTLETQVSAHQQCFTIMQLQKEDAENLSRRNNIGLKGIPEAMEADLHVSVRAIFNQLLWDPPSSVMQIDRFHHVPASRAAYQEAPRDVLCRVHISWLRMPSCGQLGRKAHSILMGPRSISSRIYVTTRCIAETGLGAYPIIRRYLHLEIPTLCSG